MRIGMTLPLTLFAAVAFTGAFFPQVMPRMTNRWYSIIGAETRGAQSDYAKTGTRAACFVMFVFVVVWILLRVF